MSGLLTLAGVPAIAIPEGSNACMGTAVLNGTTAVSIATTAFDAKTRVILTTQVPGGTVGTPYVFSQTPGAGFTVKSTSGSDTSTVLWVLIDHT